MQASIKAEALCLDVPIFLQKEREAKTWAGMFLGAAIDQPKRQLTRLLDDLSFELGEGDRLAILGRNGAGKSTLLRVLNRVYQPTSGRLRVDGSCQALLNMSLGFSPDATVRENIFLRGIAMGLRSSYLRGQIDPILAFSGLQDKATHRLRTLSSGQKMRLGFAISTCAQTDIILMDEWVGAGDADFLEKAKERMEDRVGGCKILVLASHSLGLLRSICNRGLVLEQGKMVYMGDIVSSLERYHGLMEDLRARDPAQVAASAGGASVYGCAEGIRALGDGYFEITGWAVTVEGGIASGVVAAARGKRFAAESIEHHRRTDVARHMGLANETCGFRARIRVPGAASVSDLGDGIQVFGGATNERADAPLRLAPRFLNPPHPPAIEGAGRTLER